MYFFFCLVFCSGLVRLRFQGEWRQVEPAEQVGNGPKRPTFCFFTAEARKSARSSRAHTPAVGHTDDSEAADHAVKRKRIAHDKDAAEGKGESSSSLSVPANSAGYFDGDPDAHRRHRAAARERERMEMQDEGVRMEEEAEGKEAGEEEGEEEDWEDVEPPVEMKPTLRKANCVTVKTFWGDARWGRTQLLGEIARGGWGVCGAVSGLA